jgi:Transposase zinc-binding domain
MTSINDIFRSFGSEYLQRYAQAMPKTHRKVIDAMIACRTERCGVALYQCESCAKCHQLYRSCGNRHCPTCQHHKTQIWLQKQFQRQLPTHHFLVTFTVPEQLRPFMRKNQRVAYSALFKTSSETIKKLAPESPLPRRRPAGLLRRPSHLGTNLAVTSPYPLHRPRRRSLHYRWSLVSLQNRFLSPRQSSLHHLQSQVP